MTVRSERRPSCGGCGRAWAPIAEVDRYHDPSDDDNRFGDLPYDDVLDEFGYPIV